MSRSRKKNPIGNICGCKPGTQKWWKKLCNRRLRRNEDFESCNALYKLVSGDVWDSPSDGKYKMDDEKGDMTSQLLERDRNSNKFTIAQAHGKAKDFMIEQGRFRLKMSEQAKKKVRKKKS